MKNTVSNDAIMKEVISLKYQLVKINEQILRPQVSLKDELWTVEQVASYLHKSKGTIQSHYQNKPGFPRSKKIGGTRYWKPNEVIAYTERSKNY